MNPPSGPDAALDLSVGRSSAVPEPGAGFDQRAVEVAACADGGTGVDSGSGPDLRARSDGGAGSHGCCLADTGLGRYHGPWSDGGPRAYAGVGGNLGAGPDAGGVSDARSGGHTRAGVGDRRGGDSRPRVHVGGGECPGLARSRFSCPVLLGFGLARECRAGHRPAQRFCRGSSRDLGSRADHGAGSDVGVLSDCRVVLDHGAGVDACALVDPGSGPDVDRASAPDVPGHGNPRADRRQLSSVALAATVASSATWVPGGCSRVVARMQGRSAACRT